MSNVPQWEDLSQETMAKMYAEESTLEQLFDKRQAHNGEGLSTPHYQVTVVEPSPEWRADDWHYTFAFNSHEEAEDYIKQTIEGSNTNVRRIQVVRAEESQSNETEAPFTILDSSIVTDCSEALSALNEVAK